MLLQSCGSDAPETNAEPDVQAVIQTTSGALADAKLDAAIAATPSELEAGETRAEAARALKIEEDMAKKTAVDEARAEKEKRRIEKKKRTEEASKKRRAKRRAKRKADKLAAEKAAKERAAKGSIVSTPAENATPIPVDYNHSSRKPSTTSKKSAPTISFYNTIHNYGTIEQGDKIEYKFKFKNVGKSELVVMDATASCGCTKPSYPFIPIGPGEEGYIGVIFDSKGKLGRQKPSIVITTNADPATYTIYLEGYVDSAEEKKEVNNEEDKKEIKDGKIN